MSEREHRITAKEGDIVKHWLAISTFVLGITLIFVSILLVPISAQDTMPELTEEELLARGEYLINITGCISCHTPPKPEYNVADLSELTPEQLQSMSLRALETLDVENRELAGGRVFPLGPAGVIFSRNLTPDDETGLGTWTDEEIEIAIRIGVSKDGTRLHPLMPYRNFYSLSRQDMAAIIAYLRQLPAVNNPEPPNQLAGDVPAPELVPPTELLETAPDGSNPVELGRYLVNIVMSCSDCHTAFDPETGAPLEDKWLAGGQPFEGPWGIVYGANITPHDETGIGNWTDAQVIASIRQGIRPDGRRLVLMPWEDYAVTTDRDIQAVAAYLLTGLEAVDNEVPAPALGEGFVQFEEVTQTTSPAETAGSNLPLILGGLVALVVVIVGGVLLMRRR
jgi:mono/diheme cytochrome c family protein